MQLFAELVYPASCAQRRIYDSLLSLIPSISFKYSWKNDSCVWIRIQLVVRCRYNEDNFHPKLHKRHPMSHPWTWSVSCEFKLWLSSVPVAVVLYTIEHSLDRVRTALDCTAIIGPCNCAQRWFFNNTASPLNVLFVFGAINLLNGSEVLLLGRCY